MTVSSYAPIYSTEQTRRSTFNRRSLLALSDSYLWQIESGVVRSVTWLEDGTSITLGLWGPGDIVGRALSKANPYQLECLTKVEAILLPAGRWYQVSDALILHVQRLEEFLEIVHTKPVDTALLRLLTWLGQRFGKEIEQGQLIELRLTHQEMAELIGASRVTVTRLFKEFQKQGIIERLPRKFLVLHEPQPFWHYEI